MNSSIVGECLLRDGLYQLDLNSDAIAFLVDNAGTKRALMKENSLWHKRLGHISQERIGRLIKSQILPQLVYDNIESHKLIWALPVLHSICFSQNKKSISRSPYLKIFLTLFS